MKTENGERKMDAGKPPAPFDFRLDHLKAENRMLRDGLKARGIDPDLLLRVLRKSPNTKTK